MRKKLLILLTAILINHALLFAQKQKLKVVYTDWFPYTYQEQGVAKGFEIEIFQAVIKKMKLEAEFVNYPWKRCLYNLEKGNADALISMLYTIDRDVYTIYTSEPISISKTVFFTKKDKNIEFDGDYEKLKPYKIGLISDFSYGGSLDNASYLKKDFVTNVSQLIKMTVAGRHDLSAENLFVVKAYAKKLGILDKIKFLKTPIHSQQLFVGFSQKKGLEKLTTDFSKALAEFKKTNEFKIILEKYGIKAYEMN